MFSFKRSDRVAELLRHEISLMVQEINDPMLGFVTITGVRVSDDLMEAKVFFSVFGEAEARKVSSEILTKAIPSLRRQLGRKLESLKNVPVINFIYDEMPEHAQKITAILNQIADERKQEEKVQQEPAPMSRPPRQTLGKRARRLHSSGQKIKSGNVRYGSNKKR